MVVGARSSVLTDREGSARIERAGVEREGSIFVVVSDVCVGRQCQTSAVDRGRTSGSAVTERKDPQSDRPAFRDIERTALEPEIVGTLPPGGRGIIINHSTFFYIDRLARGEYLTSAIYQKRRAVLNGNGSFAPQRSLISDGPCKFKRARGDRRPAGVGIRF